MSRFVQLHLLTSYPPSCLNRDDLGRPKTAVMGGSTRLRISSQSLKRAWRTSDVFREALAGHIGIRTKEMGRHVYHAMVNGVPLKAALEGSAASDSGDGRRPSVKAAKAREWAKTIAGVFGKSKGDNKEDPLQGLEIEQLAHFSPEEVDALDQLIAKVAESGEAPTAEDLQLLRKPLGAADIALFGRMLASAPAYNVEAAAQVAHALSVHKVSVEDDFFTAVDDLNTGEEDIGAGHMGETEFAAGLFYLYVCIDRELLRENLGGGCRAGEPRAGGARGGRCRGRADRQAEQLCFARPRVLPPGREGRPATAQPFGRLPRAGAGKRAHGRRRQPRGGHAGGRHCTHRGDQRQDGPRLR
jgi:CRISPR system Cascade subunit CasC